MRIVYKPWGLSTSFKNVEGFLRYTQKLDSQAAAGCLKSGICSNYPSALKFVKELASKPFWADDSIRFDEVSDFVEVVGKRLFIGVPAHHVWFDFDDYIEALKQGETAAHIAEKHGIYKPEVSRKLIDLVVQEFKEA